MKKKIIKWGLILVVGGLIIGGGTAFYLFNMPHRNVQSATVDYELTAAQLVDEYLKNYDASNEKYLQEDGDSKILVVSGTVASVDTDMNNQKVVLLKDIADKAGVSCTFTVKASAHAEQLRNGDKISVKGVIRAGAAYDEDLEMYEDVIMEKCDVIKI